MYYLWLEQRGGGCDYTIGCGQRMYRLNGNTLEEAKEDAKQYFDGENYGYGRGDYALEDATIFKFEADAMPILNAILKQEAEEKKAADEARKLAQEKAEFERLKKKFG